MGTAAPACCAGAVGQRGELGTREGAAVGTDRQHPWVTCQPWEPPIPPGLPQSRASPRCHPAGPGAGIPESRHTPSSPAHFHQCLPLTGTAPQVAREWLQKQGDLAEAAPSLGGRKWKNLRGFGLGWIHKLLPGPKPSSLLTWARDAIPSSLRAAPATATAPEAPWC